MYDQSKQANGSISNTSTQAQAAVDEFVKYLSDKQVPLENIEIISGLLVEIISWQTMASIEQAMDKEDKRRWDEFLKTDPNDAQQLVALDEFYKNKKNKGLEDLQNEITIKIVKSARSQIDNQGTVIEKISGLDDEQVEKALDLVNNGDLKKAEEIIGLSF
ncbi:hypothetical protein GF357_02630 [Candidatus Dojkabacteria bacterium]|nr:hypothetical protein [Candidatus Dojkabacteria bacterium]